MARDYAERARWLLKEVETAFEAENNAVCVRRCQEALELSAKAALRRLAMEYPKEHDVSEALDAAALRFPNELKERSDEIKSLLTELARVRGPAFYGYEAEGKPASEVFTHDYAERTLSRVKPIVNMLVEFAEMPL